MRKITYSIIATVILGYNSIGQRYNDSWSGDPVYNQANFFEVNPDSVTKLVLFDDANLKGVWNEIKQLKNLKSLQVSGPITSVNFELDSLSSIDGIELLQFTSDTNFVFPNSIFSMKNLKYLRVTRTNLSELPDSVIYMNGLLELSLSRNELHDLPMEISNLKNTLEVLSISYNPMDEGVMDRIAEWLPHTEIR